ncbi:hypothetical protein BDZ89DRAFT_1070540 [Hymenopellis radicata]|nr:hypothetical protein BDZ89DRAFT_1070540 [Hymenopellis radicata]
MIDTLTKPLSASTVHLPIPPSHPAPPPESLSPLPPSTPSSSAPIPCAPIHVRRLHRHQSYLPVFRASLIVSSFPPQARGQSPATLAKVGVGRLDGAGITFYKLLGAL